MATSKQPPFPNPPLEVGIPTYPTPLVPDFYTKNGHIILVEKISAEKGSYNPQPLDGSVTYTGRDANKWPSTLYLVAERPEPTGQFVFRYWANDRTLSSQNPWNYGLEYSSNNPDYPITSRTYIVPRSQYAPVAIGSVDPVFGNNQIIAQQTMVELPDDNPLRSRYVAVQRVYETIPGPVITGKRLDARGDIETVNVQTVVAGTAPTADGLLVTETKVDPVDSVKSTKTTATVTSYATLTTKGNKAGLLGTTSTTDDIVAPSTNPDALSTSVLESSVEQITATKAKKRTTTSSGPTSLSSKEKKGGLLGETTIAESIVSYGSDPDALSTSILSSSVQAIDSAKSKKTTITSTGPTSLSGAEKKSGLLGITSEVESIVAAGAAPDDLSTTVLQSSVTPIDAAKSKKVTITASGPTSLSGVSNKAGLLGQVSTAESIVAYGAAADALSTTVLQSEVTPIDAYKSKKTTITSTGPTILTSRSLKDGLLGEYNITETIVAYGSAPDPLSTMVVESKVEAIDSTKSKKTSIVSGGPTSLSGRSVNKYGSVDTLINQIVSPSTQASTSQTQGQIGGIDQYLVSDEIIPLNNGRSEQKKVVMSQPLDVVTYELTHDLSVVKTTTSMILRQDLAPPAVPSGAILDVADQDVGYPWIRRSIKSLAVDEGGNPVLPPSRTEFSTGTYTFPGIIYNWNTTLVEGKLETQLSYYSNRYPVSLVVPFEHVITYQVGEPDIRNLRFYKVITQPWARDFFNIPDNTIHPPAPISTIGKTIYQNGIEIGIQGGQSSTPTSYIVGQRLLIGGETTRWQGNIWMLRLTYVTEPATTY